MDTKSNEECPYEKRRHRHRGESHLKVEDEFGAMQFQVKDRMGISEYWSNSPQELSEVGWFYGHLGFMLLAQTVREQISVVLSQQFWYNLLWHP